MHNHWSISRQDIDIRKKIIYDALSSINCKEIACPKDNERQIIINITANIHVVHDERIQQTGNNYHISERQSSEILFLLQQIARLQKKKSHTRIPFSAISRIFCKKMKVDSYLLIPRKRYREALQLLEQWQIALLSGNAAERHNG